jgi:hypothetical protein
MVFNPFTLNLDMVGDPGGGSASGSGTSSGVGPITPLSIDLGSTPGAYDFHVRVIGFDGVTPSASQYFLVGCFRTDGLAASKVETEDELVNNEDLALATTDVVMTPNGNAVDIVITGVVGLDINWNVTATWTFVG